MSTDDHFRTPFLINALSAERSEWSGWQPRADLYRCSGKLLVKLELAGVSQQDLNVYLRQQSLVVEGRRRDLSVADTTEFLSMEISYDYFKRVFELPAGVNPKGIETEYRDGMLLIHLPYRNGDAA